MKADDLNFSEKGVAEKARMFVTLLNVVEFYKMFSKDTKVECAEEDTLKHPLDLWITAKLNELLVTVTERMDAYDIAGAARPIETFIDELSTWYVRRSRDRFKSDDGTVKMLAIQVLRRTLFHLTRIMAPFTPFIADYINRIELEGIDESVHLTEWWHPEFEKQIKKSGVLEKMQLVREIVEAGLAKRDEAGIPVRQVLQQLTVDNLHLTLDEEYLELIMDELNIKEISIGQLSKVKGQLSVTLNTEISKELRLEGIKRELVRQINNLRKKQGLTIQDKVKLSIKAVNEDY